MSNSQKKRTVSASGSKSGASGSKSGASGSKSGASGSKSSTSGRSTSSGPQVGKRPASTKDRNRAIADARKAASGGNKNQLTLWIVAAVLVIAVVVGGIIAVQSGKDDKAAAAAATDLGAGTLENGVITWGKADAPVTVDYYIDLLCPACRVYETAAAPTIEAAVKDGSAKLVVHPVAILNQQTTPAGYSQRAASALFCAATMPKGYLYMKELYAEQPAEGSSGLTDDELIAIGEQVGLGSDWSTCVSGGQFADTALTNTDDFAAKGFTGTPTILVQGQQLTSGTPEELKSAIAAAAG